MNLKFWQWLCPELGLFDTVQNRKRALAEAGPSSLAYMLGFGLCSPAAILFMRFVAGDWTGGMLPQLVAYYLGSGLFMTTYGVGYFWLVRNKMRPRLRRALNDLGIPVCMNCSYDLRGLTERCPECGIVFIPDGRKH